MISALNKYLLQFILQLTPLLLSAAIPDLVAEGLEPVNVSQ